MISFEQVSKSLDGTHRAVSNLTFLVGENELLVIVGSSGSGKTTTLKLVNRLLDPDSGQIFINNEETTRLEPEELRRKIGYVVQGVGLFPHLTVRENVGILLKLMKWGREERNSRVDELLELVRLPAERFGERMPEHLSGGEQQRVGIARALAFSPRIMLMDEPFGALDPLTREVLRGEFLSLRKHLRLTTILVTHDMTEALLLADRIGVLEEGELIAMGTPAELLENAGHPSAEAMLESPRRHARLLEKLTGRKNGDTP